MGARTPAEIQRTILRGNAIKALVIALQGNTKDTDYSRKFKCPFCKYGIVFASINGPRKHCHAGCSTKDCIAFME